MISKLTLRSTLINSVYSASGRHHNYNKTLSLLQINGARQLHVWNRDRLTKNNNKCNLITTTIRCASSDVVQSPLGNVKIPSTNVVDYCWKKSANFVEKPVVTCSVSGRTYTYGMMRMLINRYAQALLGHCGMKPGEVVGLLLPNIPEYLIACHGAFEAGLVVTFVNPLYTPDEIKRQFENAGVKMIVTIQMLVEVAITVGAQLPGYRGSISVGGDDDPGINPIETCLLPYSSGTTGLPKGVMLSHFNLVSNLVQGDIPPLMEDVDPKPELQLASRKCTLETFTYSFDYHSVLHYCKTSFSIVSLINMKTTKT